MNRLEKCRQSLDKIDKKLLKTLAERFLMVEKIGHCKKKDGSPSLDNSRFKKVLKTRTEWGKKLNLPPMMVKKIFILIHHFSLKAQL